MAVFFYTIILLGALQGLIVGALLFFSAGSKLADRLLAILLLLMALASLNVYFEYTGWFDSPTLLVIISNIVPLVLVMPMGPLIYFYIRGNLDPAFRLTRKQKFHFSPVILDIIPQLTAIIFLAGSLSGIIKGDSRVWGRFVDDYNVYADIPRWFSMTTYLWLSYKYLRSFKLKKQVSSNLKWLTQFITVFVVFQFIWLAYLIPYAIPRYTDWVLDNLNWYPVYIPLAVIIYWMGIKGYLLSYKTFVQEKRKKPVSGDFPVDIIQQVTATLKEAMEKDKLYLNPALNLDGLAAHTGISAKTISSILNQHLGRNFNEWINEYRINEFRQRINQGQLQQLTISGIAAECGFNSQATFQRIFKQLLGMSPSEYLKKISLTH